MIRSMLLVGAAVALLVPAHAGAQAARNAREAATDNRQIAVDKAQLDRDSAELRSFEQLVANLIDARKDHAGTRYQDVDAQVRAAMEREVDQARRRVGQANREVRQSRREAVGERQEAHMSGWSVDYIQAIDDSHDLRDDRRDRRTAAGRLAEMERIREAQKALAADLQKGDRGAIERNTTLAREFLAVMREDVAATKTELSEDRRERREDRRERRTDQR